MLVIKPTISLLLAAAATTTVSAGPLFKASPLTISLDHHRNNSSPQAAAAAAVSPSQEQQKVIETLTAKDGRLVTITYTPAETTPTSTLARASALSSPPWSSVPYASAGPRETSLSRPPSAAAMVVGLRVDTADSGETDDGATFATASSSSSSDDSSSSDFSSDKESAAETSTTTAKAATTTPAPPKHNPAVASALAQQGYSQETYYECKTYAATSTHCGWHVPVVYVGDGGARAGGSGGERAGRMAVGAAAACGLVVNYVLG